MVCHGVHRSLSVGEQGSRLYGGRQQQSLIMPESVDTPIIPVCPHPSLQTSLLHLSPERGVAQPFAHFPS